jgi:hypothetical protein
MTKLTHNDRALLAATQAALERRAHWHQGALLDESQRRAWSDHRLLASSAARHADTLARFDPAATMGAAERTALRMGGEVLDWEATRWREQALAATTGDELAKYVAKASERQGQAAAVRELRHRLDPGNDAEQRGQAAEPEAER